MAPERPDLRARARQLREDRDARLLLRSGGWTPKQQWCGDDGAFCVILAEAQGLPIAP